MKKLLIFVLAIVGLTACNTGSDYKQSDAERAFFTMYGPAANQNTLVFAMLGNAQYLNILMNETDDWSDLNDVKSDDEKTDYKRVFFADATLTNVEGVVTIAFGQEHALYRGTLIIDTHNQLLSDGGSRWEFVSPTATEDKFRVSLGSYGFTTIDSWESATITHRASAGSQHIFDCQVDGLINYLGSSSNTSEWNAELRIAPSLGSDMFYEEFIDGSRNIQVGSTAWGELGGVRFDYSVEETLEMMYGGYDVALNGTERVESEELATAEGYPAEFVDVVYDYNSGNGTSRSIVVRYNNEQWKLL